MPLTSSNNCRCVAEEQRTFSLGIQSTIVRMFGSVPAPLVFGAIFDSSCEYWQYECSRRGNCWVYDNQNTATRAFALSLAGVLISLVLFTMTWCLYPSGRDRPQGASQLDAHPDNDTGMGLNDRNQDSLQDGIGAVDSTDSAGLLPNQEGSTLDDNEESQL